MLTLYSDHFSTVIKQLHQSNQAASDPAIVAQLTDMKHLIQTQGDQAVLGYAHQFDGVDPTTFSMAVSDDVRLQAYQHVSDDLVAAMKLAVDQIKAFHQHQLPTDWTHNPRSGVTYGMQYRPINTVGLYVPGGRAPLPSTAMMNAIPAQLAGVKRMVLLTPPQRNGSVDPAILVAADLCGVHDIYMVGGAQAIFAAAFGTESIPRVDKIVGPGNQYVTLAKQLVYGHVDIDKPAGPSEVLVYVEDESVAAFAAADLLCQLEHDPQSIGIVISTKLSVLSAVSDHVNRQLTDCSRRTILEQSLQQSALFHVSNESHAIDLINEIASEHLVLLVDHASDLLPHISHAGSIFCGPYTPVTLGDYFAGPNHVLPTSGTARFASPLGVMDFMKYSSILTYDQAALRDAEPALKQLTDVEGLDAHYHAVRHRL